jgi:hypothetical protein
MTRPEMARRGHQSNSTTPKDAAAQCSLLDAGGIKIGRTVLPVRRDGHASLEECQGVGDHAVALILERLVADLVCPDSGADRFVDGEHAPLIRGSRVAAVSGKEFVFESVVVSPLLGCQSP